MHRYLILAIFALFLASCHNDVPGLPAPDEVKEYRFCQYEDKDGIVQCKSTYEISENDCELVEGKLCDTKEECGGCEL